MKVDPVLLSSLQQHSWTRFPALAFPVSIVGAIIDRINRDAFLRKMMDHSLVDRLQDVHRQFVSGYGALIRHDNKQKTVLPQLPQRLAHAGEKLHLLPGCYVLALRSFANNDPVTI